MKITIKQVIHPDSRFPLAVMARVLQGLMQTAEGFRDPGQWGTTGPHEDLSDYSYCTNSGSQAWHTSRFRLGNYRDHVERIKRCILVALLNDQAASLRWLEAQSISLETPFTLRGARYGDKDEAIAFERLWSLSGKRLSMPVNDCHPRARTLCDPQMIVSRDVISFEYRIAYANERHGSGWGLSSFRRDWERNAERRQPWIPKFRWVPHKEQLETALNRYAGEIEALVVKATKVAC